MRCLSLWQPWASLVVAGAKQVETRSWPIPCRGPLVIHAAGKWNRGLAELCTAEPFRSALVAAGFPVTDMGSRIERFGLPFGAIVGTVVVRACVPTEQVGRMNADAPPAYWPDHPKYLPLQISDTERAFGDYRPGRYASLLERPMAYLEPLPARGFQAMYGIPDDLLVGRPHLFTGRRPAVTASGGAIWGRADDASSESDSDLQPEVFDLLAAGELEHAGMDYDAGHDDGSCWKTYPTPAAADADRRAAEAEFRRVKSLTLTQAEK